MFYYLIEGGRSITNSLLLLFDIPHDIPHDYCHQIQQNGIPNDAPKHVSFPIPFQVIVPVYSDDRRKFRSRTSDNMDRWKSRGGKSQRGEAKK